LPTAVLSGGNKTSDGTLEGNTLAIFVDNVAAKAATRKSYSSSANVRCAEQISDFF
jgi:hypothetical protein